MADLYLTPAERYTAALGGFYYGDLITVADIDKDIFTISAIFTKTDKMDLLFIKYFACPTRVEIL